MEKNLYIIAGCNGAGKTTASNTILPYVLDCQEFVNADDIAIKNYPPLILILLHLKPVGSC
jgi:predicted ABC-type ATPase